jgi:hypothetical protein
MAKLDRDGNLDYSEREPLQLPSRPPRQPRTEEAAAAPSPTRYNTTDDWQDPYSVPNQKDAYEGQFYDKWAAANPDYKPTTAGGDPQSPYQPQTPVDPSTGGGGGGGGTAPPQTAGGLGSYLQNWMSQQSASNAGTAAQRQGIIDRLTKLADKYASPVDRNDPNIRSVADSYQGNVDRSLANYREMAAERAHAEGTPTGAFDSQVGNATMEAGRASGDFESSLMRDEMMSRRSSLTDALKSAGGFIGDQDTSDLNNRIAAIDAQLKKQGLDNSLAIGMGSNAVGAGANANQATAIGNQNNQFYDKFAYDQAHQGQTADDAFAEYLLHH